MYYTTPVLYCKFRSCNDLQKDVWVYLFTEEWDVWFSAPIRIPQASRKSLKFCLVTTLFANLMQCVGNIEKPTVVIYASRLNHKTDFHTLRCILSVHFTESSVFVMLHPLLSDHFICFETELLPLQTELSCFLVLHALSWVTPELLTFSRTQSWSH